MPLPNLIVQYPLFCSKYDNIPRIVLHFFFIVSGSRIGIENVETLAKDLTDVGVDAIIGWSFLRNFKWLSGISRDNKPPLNRELRLRLLKGGGGNSVNVYAQGPQPSHPRVPSLRNRNACIRFGCRWRSPPDAGGEAEWLNYKNITMKNDKLKEWCKREQL